MINYPDGIILSISSFELNQNEINFFKNLNPLGFILFKRNFQNKNQITKLIKNLKKITLNKKLLIFLDQEGGKVQRLNNAEFIKFPPQKSFGDIYLKNKKKAIDLAYKSSFLMGYQQKMVGIDVDFSPVCDLFVKGASKVIGDRSFSSNPSVVYELSKVFCRGLKDSGVLSVPKHFPGHGRSLNDTHLKSSKIDVDLNLLMKTDLVPFKLLDSALMVMLAHIIYPRIENKVATYSSKIISILRQNFKFKGLVISDDISMKALKESTEDKIKNSYHAGCDVILYCKGNLNEIKEFYPFIRKINYKPYDYFLYEKKKIIPKKKNFNKFKTDLIKYKLIEN